MLIPFILLALGFFGVIKGADFLIDGASSLAKRLNVPEIVLHFLYHLHHCAKVNSFDYRFVLKSPG
jgi:hypothetical protein